MANTPVLCLTSIGLLCACATNDDAPLEPRTLPLLAQDGGADVGLLGSYDAALGQAWVMAGVLSRAGALASDLEIADPSFVAVSHREFLMVDHSVAVETGFVELPLAAEDLARVCVVDGNSGQRWTVADFRVGAADELDSSLEEFAPSVLAEEEEPW